MVKILETKLKTLYPILEEGLRKLGLSRYEIVAYTTLLNLRKPADKEEILIESQKFGKIPRSKIYAVLSDLERKHLIIKKPGYPRFYEVDTRRESFEELIEKRVRDLENEKKVLEGSLRTKLDEVWSKCILMSEGIWEIDDAKVKDVTKDMWTRAEKEIMLMTRSGDWLPETKELVDILEEKSKIRDFQVFALISKQELVEPYKREKSEHFEKFLERIGAHVYHYTPGTFRMNVVDRKECLFLMYEHKKPYIYYTPIKDVADSLAHLFVLQCLASDEYISQLKQNSSKVDQALKRAIKNLFLS